MNKIWIIIQREYLTRVRKRSFIITTLLAPIGLILLVVASIFIGSYNNAVTNVAIVDESGLFKDQTFADKDKQVYFFKSGDKEAAVAQQLGKDDKSKYNAIMVIPAGFDINNPNKPAIVVNYAINPGTNNRGIIEKTVNSTVSKLRYEVYKIDGETQEKLKKEVNITFQSAVKQDEKSGYNEAAAAVGYFMGLVIYVSLMVYGTQIMKSVMEEKTNRIIEVLISSVKPFQLMMGKIIGVGAVGLTQFALWGVLMVGVQVILLPILGIHTASHMPTPGAMEMAGSGAEDQIGDFAKGFAALPFGQIALLFPLYFLGGFLLYGSLFAAVGAAIGEDGDQQSLVFPITIPIIVSIMIMINVLQNPDGSMGFWGSIIPFCSPVVMPALLPFKPDWWQIALSLVLLVLGFIGTTLLAAKIYRTGILLYGKKVNMKEILKWAFARS
jgi:ABC-2 type transport system permease protein